MCVSKLPRVFLGLMRCRQHYDGELVVTTFAGLPLWDTMQLVHGADVFFGMHGAGLTNLLWLRQVPAAEHKVSQTNTLIPDQGYIPWPQPTGGPCQRPLTICGRMICPIACCTLDVEVLRSQSALCRERTASLRRGVAWGGGAQQNRARHWVAHLQHRTASRLWCTGSVIASRLVSTAGRDDPPAVPVRLDAP